jgi:predicted TPR repeat methyltransferase
MGEMDRSRAYEEDALLYDQQAREYECFAHDVLFGMCYEYVHPAERLLDLGIGTGLASLPFARAGLEIFGLDRSTAMLSVCQSKGFAKELKCFSLLDMPLPYGDAFFTHVISCGVLHFFADIVPIIKEVSRVIDKNGIFAFNVASPPADTATMKGDIAEGFAKMDTPWGVPIFVHSHAYVCTSLREHGFEILKRQRMLMRSDLESQDEMVFATYVARRAAISST